MIKPSNRRVWGAIFIVGSIVTLVIVSGAVRSQLGSTPFVAPKNCADEGREEIEFIPHEHSYFVENKAEMTEIVFGGYTMREDTTFINYDPEALKSQPVQYRTFILTSACQIAKREQDNFVPATTSKNLQPVQLEGECMAVKELRDKHGYKIEDISVIMGELAASAGVQGDRRLSLKRSLNVYECFKLLNPASADDASEECRKLASSPYEPNNSGGVKFDKIDVEKAYAPCSQAARSERATATDQFRLGRVADAKKSYAEAADWYRKAADQGYAPAQDRIGAMYAIGEGVPKNELTAVEWLRKAADQGHAHAQYNLGVMYGEGLGVPQDRPTSAQWYLRAAQQGQSDAQYNLGVAYAEGLGIRKNPAAAVRWYEKAAGQGNSLAAYALGVILYDGADGVAINRPEATRLLTQAAEAGVEQARKVLAFIQENSQSPRISADEALGNQLEESTRRLEKEQQERRCANMQAWGDSTNYNLAGCQ